MQKYITKRNLLILNVILALILALTGFLGIVYPLISAKPVDTSAPIADSSTGVIQISAVRPERSVYDIITTNDLFLYKGPIDVKKAPPRVAYDLTKAWELNAVFNYIDGPHALIRDKTKPDTTTKQPFTIREVKVGDILEENLPPRIFNVEILEIAKDPEDTWYVKYYRHDMVDSIEEDRIFYLRGW